jgi:hypothetical protein
MERDGAYAGRETAFGSERERRGRPKRSAPSGTPRIGRLVRFVRGFGLAQIELRPSYSRRGFGRDGVRVESLEPPGVFGLRTGERAVRSKRAFGLAESGSMSGVRRSSGWRAAGRTSRPTTLRCRRIERAFGSAVPRYRRARADGRLNGASVSEGRTNVRPERAFGLPRVGATRQQGALAPQGRVTVRLEGTSVPESRAIVRLEGASAPQGRATVRLGGASVPAGWAVAARKATASACARWVAAIRVRRGFGLSGRERERDVEMETRRDQRQEGIGAGDGVRPRGGSKALKGATP